MSILNKPFQNTAPNLSDSDHPSTLLTPRKPSYSKHVITIFLSLVSLGLAVFAYKQNATIQTINKELASKAQEIKQFQEKLSQLEAEIPKANSASEILKTANSDLQNVAQALALQLNDKPSSKTIFKE